MVGMYSDWNAYWHKNVYLGWTTATPADSSGIHAVELVQLMWNRLGAGDRVWDAWSHCHAFVGYLTSHFGWVGPGLGEEVYNTKWTGR
jgi:hypothetical protein